MLPSDATRQAGCFTRRQAIDAGLTTRQVTRRVANGQWKQLVRGVFVHSAAQIRVETWMWAGLLASGPLAALSHVSAAALFGLAQAPRRIHLTVPWGGSPRLPVSRFVVYRRRLTRADVRTLQDDLVVTHPARTVVDCLSVLDTKAAMRLLDRAVVQQRVSLDDLAAVLEHLRGSHGVRLARRRLKEFDGAASRAERLLHRLLHTAGLSDWQPNFRVAAGGRTLAIVDVAFPRLRLGIEVDGMAFHTDSRSFQRDRTRQNALVAHGWTVLRFTWWDITERPDDVVGAVIAALTRLSNDFVAQTTT